MPNCFFIWEGLWLPNGSKTCVSVGTSAPFPGLRCRNRIEMVNWDGNLKPQCCWLQARLCKVCLQSGLGFTSGCSRLFERGGFEVKSHSAASGHLLVGERVVCHKLLHLELLLFSTLRCSEQCRDLPAWKLVMDLGNLAKGSFRTILKPTCCFLETWQSPPQDFRLNTSAASNYSQHCSGAQSFYFYTCTSSVWFCITDFLHETECFSGNQTHLIFRYWYRVSEQASWRRIDVVKRSHVHAQLLHTAFYFRHIPWVFFF